MLRVQFSWIALVVTTWLVGCNASSCQGREDEPSEPITGAWRAVKVHITTMDFSKGAIDEVTETLPQATTNALLGQKVEVIYDFDGATRRTYVRIPGGTVTYRLTEQLQDSGDNAFMSMVGSRLTGITEFLQMQDGHLVAKANMLSGAQSPGAMTIVETTFDRVDGPLPPADWPQRVMEAPQHPLQGGQP